MTIYQRPPLITEVVATPDRVVYATVNVPDTIADGEEYFIGKVLRTTDGGKTFDALEEASWVSTGVDYDTGDTVYHNGHLYTSLVDDNLVEPGTDAAKWQDDGAWNANGVLTENIDKTSTCAVLVSGVVVESNLRGYDSNMRQTLFNNKIFMQ